MLRNVHFFPVVFVITLSILFMTLSLLLIACVTIDRFCSSLTDVYVRRLSARSHTVTASIAHFHTKVSYTIIDSLYQPNSEFMTICYFTAALLIIIVFESDTTCYVPAQRMKVLLITVRSKQIDRRRFRNSGQFLLMLSAHVRSTVSYTIDGSYCITFNYYHLIISLYLACHYCRSGFQLDDERRETPEH